jgi:UDP-N-acetyl-D-mannosaminuronate dehydrogenase
VFGVSYKAGVGDIRESPALKIIELPANQGAELCYHDPHVPNWLMVTLEHQILSITLNKRKTQ